MMNYAFYVSTYQSVGEGQGDTQTDNGTRNTYEYYRKDRHIYGNRDHTPNWIGIYSDKNPIGVLMILVTY